MLRGHRKSMGSVKTAWQIWHRIRQISIVRRAENKCLSLGGSLYQVERSQASQLYPQF